jgi:hypothetical protein
MLLTRHPANLADGTSEQADIAVFLPWLRLIGGPGWLTGYLPACIRAVRETNRAGHVHLWTCPHFGIADKRLLEESKNQEAVPFRKAETPAAKFWK